MRRDDPRQQARDTMGIILYHRKSPEEILAFLCDEVSEEDGFWPSLRSGRNLRRVVEHIFGLYISDGARVSLASNSEATEAKDELLGTLAQELRRAIKYNTDPSIQREEIERQAEAIGLRALELWEERYQEVDTDAFFAVTLTADLLSKLFAEKMTKRPAEPPTPRRRETTTPRRLPDRVWWNPENHNDSGS